MAKVSSIDQASLEAFQTELIRAGFEAIDEDARTWSGPIFPAFKALTDAETMQISFRDGWPLRAPRVYVKGLNGGHVNAQGEVCLWQRNAYDSTWTKLDGLEQRLAEWVARAESGFATEDMVLDAHLYFSSATADLAVFDLLDLLHGRKLDGDEQHIHVEELSGRAYFLRRNDGKPGAMQGRVYFRDRVDRVPMNLDSFRARLNKNQQKNFERLLTQTAAKGTGSQCMALLAWPVEETFNTLALRMTNAEDGFKAQAMVAAPNDEDSLRLRAGKDAKQLIGTKVAVFGAGAIGSHLSLLLAECGVGNLKIVDGGLLRPGNVVRHLGSKAGVGFSKANIVSREVESHAPWSKPTREISEVWEREVIEHLTESVHLAVDATGSAPFNGYLAFILEQSGIPLVNAALFREGSVGRVQRQFPGRDRPLRERSQSEGYLLIPAGEETFALEAGCSDPVNNAPPSSVMSVASLTARVAVDALVGAFVYPEEIHEVYKPIEAPFDQVGVLLQQ